MGKVSAARADIFLPGAEVASQIKILIFIVQTPMNKSLAYLMLFIHLFNLGGTLALHQYLVYRSDKFFDEQISKNKYSVDDLTEIRIPANMPTISDWKDYVTMNGSVHFENTAYNYVKIRMTRSAIYLVCIPNYPTTRLVMQNIIDARQIADIPVPKKDHVPFGKVNFISYNYQPVQYTFEVAAVVIEKATFRNYFLIPASCITGPGQPPETTV